LLHEFVIVFDSRKHVSQMYFGVFYFWSNVWTLLPEI
jgi:hypothetical protein